MHHASAIIVEDVDISILVARGRKPPIQTLHLFISTRHVVRERREQLTMATLMAKLPFVSYSLTISQFPVSTPFFKSHT
jgi:hypothetical protein